MKTKEMEARREVALQHLEEAVQEIGPLVEESPGIVREPLLEVIKRIDEAGREFRRIAFNENTK